MSVDRTYPTADELRETVERVVDEPVRFVETGYGYSCHVTDVGESSGTSFVAIDADRTVPQVYFDAAAARGRDRIADAQQCASVAYVIESLLSNPSRVADYVDTHRAGYRTRVVADGGTCVSTTARTGLRPEADTAWLREAFLARCQYLHGDRPSGHTGGPRRGGRITDLLEEFERDPLSNDKLGQQFGWRVGTRASRGPDLALELLVLESHEQVVSALRDSDRCR